MLEGANIKLGSVISDVLGISGTRIRATSEELMRALDGLMGPHQQFLSPLLRRPGMGRRTAETVLAEIGVESQDRRPQFSHISWPPFGHSKGADQPGSAP